MRRVRHLLNLSVALLTGCQLSPLSRSPVATTPVAAVGVIASVPAAARTGILSFTVQWPTRSYAGFSAQAIPLSTNALELEIRDAQDNVVDTELLQRASGSLPVTRNVTLHEGTGYSASVKAFAELDPATDSVVIAQGSATGVEVAWGRQLPVHLTLGPVFAPTVTSLSLANAARGMTLEIQGTNFDRGQGDPWVIFPSGKQATASLSNGKLSLIVPVGAGSGNLGVKVDGITSVTTAPFQELHTLGMTATASFDRLGSDGAIYSWLGDSLTLQGTGTDEQGQSISAPSLNGYYQTRPSIGTLTNGTYTPTALGTDEVGATAGLLQASRSVIVTPMAGAAIKASTPGAVVTDVSMCQVGSRGLVAWFVPADTKVYWRFINADGSLDTLHSTPAGGLSDERMVRVASNGTSACIAYRASTVPPYNGLSGSHNVVFFAGLDPTTGAILKNSQNQDCNWASFVEAQGNSYYLNDLTAVGNNYALTYTRWNGTCFERKLNTFNFDPDGTLHQNLIYGWGNTISQVASYRDDSAAVVATDSQMVLAQHFLLNGQGTLQLTLNNPDGSTQLTKSYLHPMARNAAIATDGNQYLVIEIQADTDTNYLKSYLKSYRFDMSLNQPDAGGTTVADLGVTAPGALNYTLSLVWDGHQYLAGYVRKNAALVDGQLLLTAQPMVQALDANGHPIGSAYPMDGAGTIPSIVPSAEGGVGLWLSDAKEAVVRRIKYR